MQQEDRYQWMPCYKRALIKRRMSCIEKYHSAGADIANLKRLEDLFLKGELNGLDVLDALGCYKHRCLSSRNLLGKEAGAPCLDKDGKTVSSYTAFPFQQVSPSKTEKTFALFVKQTLLTCAGQQLVSWHIQGHRCPHRFPKLCWHHTLSVFFKTVPLELPQEGGRPGEHAVCPGSAVLYSPCPLQ